MKKFHFSFFLVTISFYCMAQVPQNGLISYFPFNDSAVDIMENAIIDTIQGAIITQNRFGEINSAFLFDGVDDYIAIRNFNELNPENQISFSIWAQALANTSNCMLMLYPDDNSDRCVTCAQYKGSIYWDYGDIFNNGRMHIGSIPFDTTWHHYVYQINATEGLKEIYMDGGLLGSESNNNILSDIDRSLWIGGGTDENPGNIRFHGRIDDIRIYNRILDSDEVFNLYNEEKCFEYIIIHDTITVIDTIPFNDTILIFDTIPFLDTVNVTVYDNISVSDTLIIDAVFTGLDSEPFANQLKVYPNPARRKIIIDTGEEFEKMAGHTIRILSASGKIVFVTAINERLIELSVDELGSRGLYILQIIDFQSTLISSKKILLE